MEVQRSGKKKKIVIHDYVIQRHESLMQAEEAKCIMQRGRRLFSNSILKISLGCLVFDPNKSKVKP